MRIQTCPFKDGECPEVPGRARRKGWELASPGSPGVGAPGSERGADTSGAERSGQAQPQRLRRPRAVSSQSCILGKPSRWWKPCVDASVHVSQRKSAHTRRGLATWRAKAAGGGGPPGGCGVLIDRAPMWTGWGLVLKPPEKTPARDPACPSLGRCWVRWPFSS